MKTAILELSKAASPGLPSNSFEAIKPELNKVIDLPLNRKRTGWNSYLGWAAALIFAGGLVWMYLENEKLKTEIEVVSKDKRTLEEQILDARSEVADTEEILNRLRDQNVAVVALGRSRGFTRFVRQSLLEQRRAESLYRCTGSARTPTRVHLPSLVVKTQPSDPDEYRVIG